MSEDLYRVEYLTGSNREQWEGYCQSCADAWYWHTVEFQDFITAGDVAGGALNKSFLVYSDDIIVAVVPLLLCTMQRAGGILAREMVYSGWATPYPAIKSDLPDAQAKQLSEFIFGHINEIAEKESVLRAVFSVSYQQRLHNRCLRRNIMLDQPGFLDVSEYTHTVDLGRDIKDIESGFRRRYMRYIRANKEKIDVQFLAGKDIPAVYIDECRDVCRKDSSQDWPEGKLSYMFRAAVAGNGIFIRCFLKQNKRPIGYLFIIVYKNYAFDFAVAVDDEYKDLRVSHAMKAAAAGYLKLNNAKSYELGIATINSSLHRIADEKQRAITYFKRGFATDIVPLFIAEKYFKREYFCLTLQRRIDSFQKDLFLKEYAHEKV